MKITGLTFLLSAEKLNKYTVNSYFKELQFIKLSKFTQNFTINTFEGPYRIPIAMLLIIHFIQ